ncbi:hypothetical protein ACFQVD_10170 [Streptosporangium amethystogenes subsp. fukuiense]|uniref:Transposase n=1 Tax=Streptosporangium amethystogenes subsp. fukuiense TaxID=698418 RepID=A0ABW2SW15_9ACTN
MRTTHDRVPAARRPVPRPRLRHPSWPTILATLLDRRHLTASNTAWAMEQVVRGAARASAGSSSPG